MPNNLLTPEQALAQLAETPRRLAALTAGLAPAQSQTAPNPDEWSASEVLAHLRACADMWGGSIMTIIAEDTPTLRAINPRTWINRTDYLDVDFQFSLRAFASQRTELLVALEALPPEGWLRTARVTGAGRPLVRSVQFYAGWLARHERSHVKQIARIAHAKRATRA